MKFYTSLYIGESVKKPKKVMRKLKSGSQGILSNIYVIVMAEGTDQLEIYAAKYLRQSYYKRNPLYVIGIAQGYEEAVSLVTRMVEESMKERGDCNLKAYLMQNSQS